MELFLYMGIAAAFVLLVYLACMAFVRHDEKKEAERRRAYASRAPARDA